ncbi:deoxyribodipyrimidine photolyase isoform A [Chlorella sorokiniana]|uniref:Deoxyribodipyrimidine photolyase isoform A n=1 Tax=Chlorella sorokiniana TaxID=3076 RepID=A0A2P6TI47_CHLSO|nr:deoxyribodipyrimidine photolyase isoform A [Chlorella sorokiniana]|eukprot:PRW33974.1 deoxyribodipyrimidine photolyase isoform A [Chlorella sorokiniana]
MLAQSRSARPLATCSSSSRSAEQHVIGGRRVAVPRAAAPLLLPTAAARAGPVQLCRSSAPSGQPAQQQQATLLWYKHDLRLDDHPGWQQAAAAAGPVVPVFCFDPARYAQLVLPPGGAEALVRALTSLDRSLRQRGSALIVRVGPWEQQLPALAAQLGAAAVVAEAEVEADWCAGVAAAAAALPPGVALKPWSAPLLAAVADDFRELKKQRPDMLAPLAAPAELPALPAAAAEATGDGSAGLGLTAAQLRQLAAEAYKDALHPQLLPAAAAKQGLGGWGATGSSGSGSISASFSEEEQGGRLIDTLNVPPGSNGGGSSGAAASASAAASRSWDAELAAEIAAGEGPVLDALTRYFCHLETTAGGSGGSSWEEQAALAEAIAQFDMPATPDGCFPALFGRALALGVVSKRRLFAEAAAVLQQQPEQARPESFNPLVQLGWLLTSGGGAIARQRRQRKAAAAAAAAEAKDFHEQLAAGREGRAAHGATLHHWRWRGLLTDYLAAQGAPAGSTRPAILLCHGFGAFSEHYRGNVAALAAAGYDVYAPTLPGYGRAEKPVLPYGQDLWRDFLADFVLQVVRRPVVVAGNSIGGFISASMAGDYPGLVEGLVLLNSAGKIEAGYRPPAVPPPVSAPPPFVVDAVSRGLFAFLEGDVTNQHDVIIGSCSTSGLFAFLEGDVTNQLRRVYPVRPERADEWLGGEIARAARDPGALGVFRSVFYLPKPRALNWLVATAFGKPTLVLQGVKDPLNNAPVRAEELGRSCPNAEVVKLDAGHCPHDEVPDQFNSQILRFIEQRVLPAMEARQARGGARSGAAAEAAAGAAAAAGKP